MTWFRDPAFALALFLALAPATAVLQFRAIAPLALLAMAAAVVPPLVHAIAGPRGRGKGSPAAPGAGVLQRLRRGLPVAVWLALALMLWGAASSLWAIEPERSLFEGVRMAGLVLLAGAAAMALAMPRPQAHPRVLPAAPPRALQAAPPRALHAAPPRVLQATPPRALPPVHPQQQAAATPQSLSAAVSHAVAQAPAALSPHPLSPWLLGGLLLGAAMAFADQMSGQWLRAAVRGLHEWDASLGFGLKPAATVLALFLPLALARPVPLVWRGATLVAVLAGIFCMPAQAAKIGVLIGLAAFLVVRVAGPRAARAIAVAAALLLLLAPPLLGAALARGPDVSALQGSASHRVLIWDFTLARIAERPWLGWGMESSRLVPGGRNMIPTADLERFGLAGQREWFDSVRAQRLPLHTHNAPLQIWLELGAIGAALAAALVLSLGWHATSPGGAGAFAAAFAIGSLSYGIWQGWWLCLLAMLALTARQLSRARSAQASSA